MEKLIKDIDGLYNDFDFALSDNNKSDFVNESLDIGIKISEKIRNIFKERGVEDKYSEDEQIELFKRLKSLYKIKGLNVLTIDELEDKIIEKFKYLQEKISLGFDIFPALEESKMIKNNDELVGEIDGNSESDFNKEPVLVDKFGILLKVLLKENIDWGNIVIYQETLDKKRMRKIPYDLIHLRINGKNKTIVTSDVIGQATFVYHGLINTQSFINHSKGEEIDGKNFNKVEYSKYYFDDLSEAILEEELELSEGDSEKINIDKKILDKYGFKKIMYYRHKLESIEEELKEKANIPKIEGKYFFEFANGSDKWPRINGKLLGSFPSKKFNKEVGLGNKDGFIGNKTDLQKLFKLLGLPVIDNEVEIIEIKKSIYKEQIEGIEEELKREANIPKIDGKYFFGFANGAVKWPKIDGKSLGNFPNNKFNIEAGLGDKYGVILNKIDLQKLFKLLGIPTVEDEQEIIEIKKSIYKEQIEGIEEELEREANIPKIDGKYFFGFANGFKKWPKINGKSLGSFPSCAFNKNFGLGNKNGVIGKITDLQELFKLLGIPTVEDEQEVIKIKKFYYREQIELIEEQLAEKADIHKIDGKYFFGAAANKGSRTWPKIDGKPLSSFFADINKIYNIGDEYGHVYSKEELKETFKIIGLDVNEDEKNIYREQIESIEVELKRGANIPKIDGKYFFGTAVGCDRWPRINGKRLKDFPSIKYNIENGLGDENGRVSNPDLLKKSFNFFGVKTIENIKDFYRKKIESIEVELKRGANIPKIDGKYFFGFAVGCDNWPRINGKRLKDFPSTDYNKRNGLGDENGEVNSPELLKKSFNFFGVDIIENEEDFYKKPINEILLKFEEAGIIIEDGDISEIKNTGKWKLPKLSGEGFSSFPRSSVIYDKKHG